MKGGSQFKSSVWLSYVGLDARLATATPFLMDMYISVNARVYNNDIA